MVTVVKAENEHQNLPGDESITTLSVAETNGRQTTPMLLDCGFLVMIPSTKTVLRNGLPTEMAVNSSGQSRFLSHPCLLTEHLWTSIRAGARSEYRREQPTRIHKSTSDIAVRSIVGMQESHISLSTQDILTSS